MPETSEQFLARILLDFLEGRAMSIPEEDVERLRSMAAGDFLVPEPTTQGAENVR